MLSFLPAFARRRLDPAQRYGLRLTLFAAGLSLIGIPFAWLLIAVSGEGPVVEWDRALSTRLFEIKAEYPAVTDFLNGVSYLGHPIWFWILVGSVAVYLWRHRLRRLVAFLLASTIGGSLVNTAVKVTVDRDRPTFVDPEAITFQTGKSFPSGHVMSSTIAYGALLLIFLPLLPDRWRRWAYAAYAGLVAAIAASRLGLGVHYLSDVVGGLVLGAAWLMLSTAAFAIWRVERGRPAVRPPVEGVEPEAAEELKPGAGS